MLYLGETYPGKSDQRVSCRNSTVICYSSDGVVKYGCGQLFILCKQQNRKYIFARAKELSVVNKNESSHIVMIRDENCEHKLMVIDNILHNLIYFMIALSNICVDFQISMSVGSESIFSVRFSLKYLFTS